MKLEVDRIDWAFRVPFRISYRVRTHAETIHVTLRDGDYRGRGEAAGVSYRGETADGLLDQIEALRPHVEKGLSLDVLQNLLPPGGARNALDCALWDLEAKRSGRRVAEMLGYSPLKAIETTYTLGLNTPASMAQAARDMRRCGQLKLKMGDDEDLERVRAVRSARPDAMLMVDANQAWSRAKLEALAPELASLQVSLIEQPLPAGRDEDLRDFVSPVPLCADESCQTRASLPALLGLYSFVNIKLDKTGGLTEALALADDAKARGFRLMIGSNGGSSLGMAPAFHIAQICEFVDLDGPLLGVDDVKPGFVYDGGIMAIPDPALWG